MNGSRSVRSTPANARRTGNPSPSKPPGAVTTARTGRTLADPPIRGSRSSWVTSSTVIAGMSAFRTRERGEPIPSQGSGVRPVPARGGAARRRARHRLLPIEGSVEGRGGRDDPHLLLDLLGRGHGWPRLDQTGLSVPPALGAGETPLLRRRGLLRLHVLALSLPECLWHGVVSSQPSLPAEMRLARTARGQGLHA